MDSIINELVVIAHPDAHSSTSPTYTSVHECYLEVSKDVMMRFYNLGLSRVSTAAHLYALEYRLWKRGKFIATPPHRFGSYMHGYST